MMKSTTQKSSKIAGNAPQTCSVACQGSLLESVSEGIECSSPMPENPVHFAGKTATQAPFSAESAKRKPVCQTAAQSTGSASVVATPERIHPALWRASQIARSPGIYANTGYPEIAVQLPGGGWPLGNLIEVMTPRAGIGEMQLFKSALCGQKASQPHHPASVEGGSNAGPDQRPIVLIQPPYTPQTCAWAHWGIAPSRLLWLSPKNTADALWAAEHILNSGAFAALVLWQNALRDGALRRLQLSAQKGDTLFVLVRALSAARQSSPAPLRLALHPVPTGLHVHIVKRRGSVAEQPIHISLYPGLSGRDLPPGVSSDPHSAYSAAFTESHHANMDSRPFTASHARHTLP
ncbi:MAG: hypothetical protein ACTH1W_06210 [Advenella sp.]|uniref:hypothetical protein n=1 Tax=Advenella sp. S44 TaxID=1982755 RepID=UPI000C2A9754|nr:hypothetical protein [Advenella sp. S44]